MKKLLAFCFTILMFATASAQQQILLLTETFENPTNVINIGAGVGTNSGNNSWTINNQYNGQPLYPNTPPQDSVISGTINGAPNSKYLHIRNAVAAGVSNANWEPTAESDRFCYIGSPFCTLGMTDVIFTFFWISEGDSNAYGEVYYKIDGGPWIQTGQTKYNAQSKWKYEIIQNPAFNDVQNLQLGFRWVNGNAGGTPTVSWGIDDIIAVGTYDDAQTNPVDLTVTVVFPDTVCQDGTITIGYKLSAPLCDGTYQIELSNNAGSFAAPIDRGVFNIFAPDTTGFISFQAPDNVAGNCFKIRINRISPLPTVTGVGSACFGIKDCPETVITNNAPVMNDADTTCVMSVIDVKFNSFGVYNPANRYIAELSDSLGSFATPFFLGQNVTKNAFPAQPGNVAGLIPASVPAACGYYIRIRSTSPASIGSIIGPFCLAHCDELTNDHTDLQFCIGSPTFPLCDTFRIQPNYWNGQAQYDTCNDWKIELRSMMDFSLVNSGGLGIYHDSLGGNFNLCMPAVRELLPMAPGAYYMRIVSDCSDQPWNQTGSVIRLTVGAPDTTAPVIEMTDTISCNSGLIAFEVNPFKHPPSDYIWNSNFVGNPVGDPFEWPYNPLLVNITPGTNTGDYVIYVRERNFGCMGPYSQAGRFTIITTPSVSISGPKQVCLGDTVTYKVGYLKETYYNWDAPGGVSILDEANSETTVIFDKIGTFDLANFSLNDCGGDSGTYSVKVVTLYSANSGPDQTVCEGEEVTLHASSSPVEKSFITQDTASQGREGAMFNIIAHGDVVIDSFAVKFLSNTIDLRASIYGKPGTYRSYEQNIGAWTEIGSYNTFPAAPLGQMTVIPVLVNTPIAAGDTFAYYITTTNTAPIINIAYSPGIGIQQEKVYKTDGVIDFAQGTANNYPFGASVAPRVLNCRIYYSTKAGLHYLWNTGDTLPTLIVSPTQTTDYWINVYDTSGCKNRDTTTITVNPKPAVNAGPDTLICKGVDYTMPATSSASSVEWQPQVGLDDYTTLNPAFNYGDSVIYVLTATGNGNCKAVDSVLIRVKGPVINVGPDTALCTDNPYQIQGTATAGNIVWNIPADFSDATSASPNYLGTGGAYQVALTDVNGCIAYDSLNISVIPCESFVKVPQAFTPNGDGTNDHFTVFAENLADYEIRIFNRWGEQVYNSRDLSELNDLSKGWDGSYKGKMENVGTFAYYINAKDLSGKTVEKKGNLTLIR